MPGHFFSRRLETMDMNRKPAEDAGIVGVINPASLGPGTADSGWVDASKFARFMAVIQTGVLGAAATLDAKIQHATDGTGAGAEDVTGKSITQIAKATGDNVQAVINFVPEELKGAA